MSQEKVDYNKKQKANRKELVKKEKRARVLRIVVAVVIIAAALGWFGYSVYQNNRPAESLLVQTDYTAIETYTNALTY